MIGSMLHTMLVSMTKQTTQMENRHIREHRHCLLAYNGATNKMLTIAVNGFLIIKPPAAIARLKLQPWSRQKKKAIGKHGQEILGTSSILSMEDHLSQLSKHRQTHLNQLRLNQTAVSSLMQRNSLYVTNNRFLSPSRNFNSMH